jgi:hypothetical protein
MKLRWALAVLIAAAVGCQLPVKNNLPPASMLQHPGPGVGGPGPGVMTLGPPAPSPYLGRMSQVAFVSPEGAMISWDAMGNGGFDSEPLVFPGRFNFGQMAIYRLKLTNIPGRPGVELYPTLEIAPTLPRTDAYLEHNAIPFQLTEEDFDQVLSGNFVTKVIYLPDAEYQELALAGVETLVSTRLDPGVDPIIEADRRGAILAIIRLGNKDLEVPGGADFAGGMGGPVPMGPSASCDPNANVALASAMLNGGPALPGGVAGVTVPQYGMPITGTPIGLPGPPHIPLGVPAGLKKHTIHNHTLTHLPHPTKKVKVHVKQSPGISYPKPASRVFIHEKANAFALPTKQPLHDRFQHIGPPAGPECDTGAPCPPGAADAP